MRERERRKGGLDWASTAGAAAGAPAPAPAL